MPAGDVFAVKMGFFVADSGKSIRPGFTIEQGGANVPTAAAVRARVVTLWNAIRPSYGSGVTLNEVCLRRIQPIEQVEICDSTGLPLSGSNVITEEIAPSTAVVFSWRTGSIGRRFRGRTFFPPPSEAVTSGNLAAATAQTFADAADDMIDGFIVDGNAMVVFSRGNPLAPDFDVPITTLITVAKVDQRFRVQRRRQQRAPTYSTGV